MNIIVQMEKIYNSILSIIISCLFVSLLSGCASMRPPQTQTYDDSIHNYRYFYIPPIGNYTSSSGVYGNQYGVFGGPTKSINPSSVISGILFKNGFIQVNEVIADNANETMIVNFGETGRREVNLGYSIEITIQFISASTQHPICICTAEGKGETEADDVLIAIQRALGPLFNTKDSNSENKAFEYDYLYY